MKHQTVKSKSVSKTTPNIKGVRHGKVKPPCCRRLDLDEDVVVENVEKIYDFNIQSESSAFDALFGSILDLPTKTYHRTQEVFDPFAVLGLGSVESFNFEANPVQFNWMSNEEFNRLIDGF